MKLSQICFRMHWTCIYVTFLLPFVMYESLIIHILVSVSWYLNNNKCIISQLEYKLFGNTFLGNGPKFIVPFHLRFCLYFEFVIFLCFHKMYN